MSCSSEGQAPARTIARMRTGCQLASLALALLPLAVGCHALGFLRPRDRDRAAEKVDRPGVAKAASPALPGKHSFRVAPYVFLSDAEIDRNQPLFKELAQLRDQVYKELLLPPGTAVVQVYLFETKERYDRFMKERYPDLPSRRAFFVAQPRAIGGAEDLLVYTYTSGRIRQDLRHELTHALLHSVVKDVPLWLDEGLAEYFELPPERRGVNAAHVEQLRRGLENHSFTPELGKLERLKEVDEMGPGQYRESWAWVHLMLHSRAEARTVLLSYLQQLRGSRHPGALGPKLARVFPDLEGALRKHLAQLEADAARSEARADGGQ
jgi:Protein of unknown function (DUF1570)